MKPRYGATARLAVWREASGQAALEGRCGVWRAVDKERACSLSADSLYSVLPCLPLALPGLRSLGKVRASVRLHMAADVDVVLARRLPYLHRLFNFTWSYGETAKEYRLYATTSCSRRSQVTLVRISSWAGNTRVRTVHIIIYVWATLSTLCSQLLGYWTTSVVTSLCTLMCRSTTLNITIRSTREDARKPMGSAQIAL